jgi:hypothetical protein
MDRSPHIIHRQSLEVDFRRPGQDKGMQDRVAAVYYQRILPQLANLFDGIGYGPEALRIPVLSIDCGEISEADWEERLTERVVSSLTNELQSYRGSALKEGNQDNRDGADSQWAEDFIHFVKWGKFQWESRKEAISDFEKRFKPEPAFLDDLARVLHVSADAMNRLFHHFSSHFIRRLCDAFVARLSSDDAAYVAFLRQVGVNPETLSRSVISAYGAIRDKQATKPGRFSIVLLSIVWPALDVTHKTNMVQGVHRFLKNKQTDGKFSFATPSFIASLRSLAQDEFPASTRAFQSKGPTGQAIGRSVENTVSKGSEDVRLPDKATHEEPFYLGNAGLVLAYPFIEPLMQHVGLIGEDIPFSVENRAQAALLLHYLVYASPAFDESALALNKVLCGLRPESFVNLDVFECTPAVKQECEDVLHSIVTHWHVLRNTSAEGLRETFLQREGKLTRRANNWLLQVDSRGVDVLMASLPWSIGIIKLPWMECMLYVEWI